MSANHRQYLIVKQLVVLFDSFRQLVYFEDETRNIIHPEVNTNADLHVDPSF